MDASVGYLPCYLAEWYRADFSRGAVEQLVTALRAASEDSYGESTKVRLVAAVAVPADEVLYAVFAATSSETITEACGRVGMPPERLTADVGVWFAST